MIERLHDMQSPAGIISLMPRDLGSDARALRPFAKAASPVSRARSQASEP
jgi:hypothetical protein